MTCPMGISCHAQPDCQDMYCPGRPKTVARVGLRYPAAAPLPPTEPPRLLKRAAWAMLSGIGGLICYGLLVLAFVVD